MKLTADELREIAEREQKATVGPWKFMNWSIATLVGSESEVCNFGIHNDTHCISGDEPMGDDKEFIAASRTDIPRLLAHIKALEEEYQREINRLNCKVKEAEGAYINCLEGASKSFHEQSDKIAALEEGNKRYETTLKSAETSLSYFVDLYGEDLGVINWHKNGDYEPFDNFLNESGAYETLELVRNALYEPKEKGTTTP
jgi:hypothetical protein